MPREQLPVPVLFLLLVVAFAACSCDARDSCRSYSSYTCEQLEKQHYNVYFFSVDDKKDYALGVANSLSGCQQVAHAFAYNKGFQSREWSYICCLKTANSECAEKHR